MSSLKLRERGANPGEERLCLSSLFFPASERTFLSKRRSMNNALHFFCRLGEVGWYGRPRVLWLIRVPRLLLRALILVIDCFAGQRGVLRYINYADEHITQEKRR